MHNQTWYETNLLSPVIQICLDNILERQCHTLSIVIEGHRPIGFWLEHGDFNDFMEWYFLLETWILLPHSDILFEFTGHF